MAVKIEDSLQVAAAPSDNCLEIGRKGTLSILIFLTVDCKRKLTKSAFRTSNASKSFVY